jgi:acyl-ACP thioesterase
MYSFDSMVRYSELDESGKLSLLSIFNYFQDCSTFQSESLGKGIDYLKSKNVAWWLANWQVEILKRPKLCDKIKIYTFAYDFKNMYGYRNFAIEDDQGELLVRADSIWFYYDIANGKPKKVEAEDVAVYMKHAKVRFDMPATQRKINIPGEQIPVGETLITRQYIDTNHHVNNAYYVEIAKDALESKDAIKYINVQYKTAAKLGDKIFSKLSFDNHTKVVELTGENNESYAIVSFA